LGKEAQSVGPYLESMGAKVHPYSDPVVKYHAKYLLADDGSRIDHLLNLTGKWLRGNLRLHPPDPRPGSGGGSALSLFDVDWLAPHSTLSPHVSQRLIIGPERARAQFSALLGSAKHSIHIIDHKLSDPAIQALLKSKKARGVDVQVLGRGNLGGLLAHGKLMIVDGRIAVIGSMARRHSVWTSAAKSRSRWKNPNAYES